MNIRTGKILFFFIVPLLVSLSAVDGFAERTLVIQMDEVKCDTLSVSGKPRNGGYHVEKVWSQSPGEDVVSYSIDKDKGLICFQPLSVGSAKIRVRGQRYELDRYGKQKSSEPFYRAFKVRIRPEKKSSTSGRMY
ncbi:MAG: hypothetical protein PVJ11_13690 [Syntrophobacterales bacterium]|jgi:hypothetical protein